MKAFAPLAAALLLLAACGSAAAADCRRDHVWVESAVRARPCQPAPPPSPPAKLAGCMHAAGGQQEPAGPAWASRSAAGVHCCWPPPVLPLLTSSSSLPPPPARPRPTPQGECIYKDICQADDACSYCDTEDPRQCAECVDSYALVPHGGPGVVSACGWRWLSRAMHPAGMPASLLSPAMPGSPPPCLLLSAPAAAVRQPGRVPGGRPGLQVQRRVLLRPEEPPQVRRRGQVPRRRGGGGRSGELPSGLGPARPPARRACLPISRHCCPAPPASCLALTQPCLSPSPPLPAGLRGQGCVREGRRMHGLRQG